MRVMLFSLCVLFSLQIRAQEITGSIVGKLVDNEVPLTTVDDNVLNGTPVDVALFAWATSL